MNKKPPRLILEALPDRKWRLDEDVTVSGNSQDFTVKAGYVTDLASTPRIIHAILPPYGTYTAPAVLHDLLWQISIAEKEDRLQISGESLIIFGQEYPLSYLLDPVDVDGIFRKAMKQAGTSFPVRWAMYAAVRVAAIATGRTGSMRFTQWLQLALVFMPFNLALLLTVLALV